MNVHPKVDEVRKVVRRIPDPEIPVLTVEELGILRDVERGPSGRITVTLTPTYLGCPAMDSIRDHVRRQLDAAGHQDVDVRTMLAPAWTSDWITEEGRAKLRAYGIAPPPDGAALAHCSVLQRQVSCPRCGSEDTREVSRFGSTPCQAQMTCNACLEPFHRFKAV